MCEKSREESYREPLFAQPSRRQATDRQVASTETTSSLLLLNLLVCSSPTPPMPVYLLCCCPCCLPTGPTLYLQEMCMLVDIISLKSCVYNHSFATVRTTAAYYNDYPAMIDILGQRVLLLLIPFLRILGNCHGEDCLSRLCIYNAARTQTRLDVLYSSLTTDQSINIFWCQYILCIPYNSKLYFSHS